MAGEIVSQVVIELNVVGADRRLWIRRIDSAREQQLYYFGGALQQVRCGQRRTMYAHRPHESDGRASGSANQSTPYSETRRRRIGLMPVFQGINFWNRRKAGDHLTYASSGDHLTYASSELFAVTWFIDRTTAHCYRCRWLRCGCPVRTRYQSKLTRCVSPSSIGAARPPFLS